MSMFKKSTSDELEKTLCILLIAVMVLIPFAVTIERFIWDEIAYATLTIGAPEIVLYPCGVLLLYMLVIFFLKKENRSLQRIDIVVAFSVLALVISTIFAESVSTAVVGEWYTREGLLMNLVFLIIFVSATLVRKERYRKWLFITLIIVGIYETFYAVMQSVFLSPYFGIIENIEPGYRAFGTTINQDPFGALMLLFAGVTTGAAMIDGKTIRRYMWIILTLVLLYGLLLSGTRAAMLGYIVMLPFAFFLKFRLKKKGCLGSDLEEKLYFSKKQKVFFAAASLLTILALMIPAYPVLVDVFQRSVKDLSGSISGFASGRVPIWKDAWSISLENFITGVGVSNYRYVSIVGAAESGDLDLAYSIAYIAHNELLDILVNQGIIGLVAFLILLFSIFKGGMRHLFSDCSRFERALVFGCIIALFGYQVNALFGLRVVTVTPYLYVIMGLIVPRSEKV